MRLKVLVVFLLPVLLYAQEKDSIIVKIENEFQQNQVKITKLQSDAYEIQEQLKIFYALRSELERRYKERQKELEKK